MKLVYYTKGGAYPQGKPRVYFTGHPDDLQIYSRDIFADILKTQNCAIYYDEETKAPCDQKELLRELEQMQMVVIPVTRRFLREKNRALDVEFPFAMEHHIPVLPLMQEPNLEGMFNEICGGLQMLNKNDPDPTATPYEEKLKTFLTSVLIGDELAAKVRAAFDAYIFLSYRKKDRKYAQQLMKLIHQNDFCRDIAIWYDEFLTPGENFNEAIAAALEKCSLFTLAVTPNIVEPGNYVMALEYPEAKKSGKPILPLELVPTDRDALQRSFPGIPPCTDAHNSAALSEVLLDTMRKLAIRENSALPEHNFFIGLAYLNGIDVEVDRLRALSLITGAAESGLPEAMEKLVSMYRNGDGVARDYQTAIQWQRRLVELGQARFEESGAEKDGFFLFSYLLRLGNYLEEQNNFDAAKEIYQQTLELGEKAAERYGTIVWKGCLMASHGSLGSISRKQGRLDEALFGHFYSAWGWGIEQFLQSENNNYFQFASVHDLSVTNGHTGLVYEKQGKLDIARAYYLSMLSLNDILFRETEITVAQSNMARSNMAFAYARLGNLNQVQGKLEEAENYYLQALELNKQLAAGTESVEARQSLSMNYTCLGNLSRKQNLLDKAENYYLQALELYMQMVEEAGTAKDRRDLAGSYYNLGNISQQQGLLDKAENYYLQALELYMQMGEEAGTAKDRRDLAGSYYNLGNISQQQGLLDKAKNYYFQALEWITPLAEETGAIEDRHNFASSYYNLGNISQEQGLLDKAEYYYLQALKWSKQLAAGAETIADRQLFSNNYACLGNLLKEQGLLDKAEYYYLQARELCAQLVEETGTIEALRSLSICCCHLGSISQEQSLLDKAENYYLQARELCTQLVEETGSIEVQRDLSNCYCHLGRISQEQGRLDKAENYYLQERNLLKQFAQETGAIQDWRNLSVSYSCLGTVNQEQGLLDAAKNDYLQAMELDKYLARETRTVQAWSDLAADCDYLGQINMELGLLDEAEHYYLLMLDLRKQLAEEIGTEEAWRDLSISYSRAGSVKLKQGKRAEAKTLFFHALEVRMRLYKETQTVQDAIELANDIDYVSTLPITDSLTKLNMLTDAYNIYNALAGKFPDTLKYHKQKDLVQQRLNALKEHSDPE